MKAGLEWSFYNREKYRVAINVMYSFAFKDAGYFRYHFSKPVQGIDFYYQNTTRGNGITITAGVPIKLVDFSKHKKDKKF